jgi:hypothetical protein
VTFTAKEHNLRRERSLEQAQLPANCLSAMLDIFVDLNLTGLVNVKVRRISQNPPEVMFGLKEALRINWTCDGKALGSAGRRQVN